MCSAQNFYNVYSVYFDNYILAVQSVPTMSHAETEAEPCVSDAATQTEPLKMKRVQEMQPKTSTPRKSQLVDLSLSSSSASSSPIVSEYKPTEHSMLEAEADAEYEQFR